MARRSQYKVWVLFKEIKFDGLLGKTNYNAMSTEFHESGSPHFNLFTWMFTTSNIENEAAYVDFIEEPMHAQPPDHLSNASFLS